MRAVNKLSTILALGLAMLLFRIGPADAAVFEVVIDTSGLSGEAVMAFDFSDSDSDSNHHLVISDFMSDGGLFFSAAPDPDPADCQPSPPFPFPIDGTACKDPLGSRVTGTFGRTPSVTIWDVPPPGILPISYYQRITLPGKSSSHISFSFEMFGGPTTEGASPDGFAFYLLNPGDPQDPAMNPGGDVLGPGPLILYTFGVSCATEFSEGRATCDEVRASVPEPGSVVLTIAALLTLTLARLAASASHRRRAVRA